MSIENEFPKCPSCRSDVRPTTLGAPASYCSICDFPQRPLAGKYAIQKKLAQGGFGSVYVAHHLELEHAPERVVKLISKEQLDNDVLERRFLREVQLTALLSQRNEHVVRIYDDFGKDKDFGFYYVMEFLQGETLHDRIKKRGKLPLSEALHLFRQFCVAMGEAHHEGIIHRDLKPHNLMIVEKYQEKDFIKVLDFGIAKPLTLNVDAELTMEQTEASIMGTPLYMAPEQWLSQSITAATDIYAMGVILYQCVTGKTPYHHYKRDVRQLFLAHIEGEYTPVSLLAPELQLPGDFEDEIFRRALAKEPEDRFATVEDFWQALLPYAGASATPLRPLAGAPAPLDPEGTAALPMLEDGSMPLATPDDSVPMLPSGSEVELAPFVEPPPEGPKGQLLFRIGLVAVGLLSIAIAGLLVWGPKRKAPAQRDRPAVPLAQKATQKGRATPVRRPLRHRPAPTRRAAAPGACQPGQRRSCYTGPPLTRSQGPCAPGTQRCVGGLWGPCTGQKLPTTERCNGKDDDCDGQIDETFPTKGATCRPKGACGTGRWRCIKRRRRCVPNPGSSRQTRVAIRPSHQTFKLVQGYRITPLRGSGCVTLRPGSLKIKASGFTQCAIKIQSGLRSLHLKMMPAGLVQLPGYCKVR